MSNPPGTETCGTCKGTGHVAVARSVRLGTPKSPAHCPACEGKGYTPKSKPKAAR